MPELNVVILPFRLRKKGPFRQIMKANFQQIILFSSRVTLWLCPHPFPHVAGDLVELGP